MRDKVLLVGYLPANIDQEILDDPRVVKWPHGCPQLRSLRPEIGSRVGHALIFSTIKGRQFEGLRKACEERQIPCERLGTGNAKRSLRALLPPAAAPTAVPEQKMAAPAASQVEELVQSLRTQLAGAAGELAGLRKEKDLVVAERDAARAALAALQAKREAENAEVLELTEVVSAQIDEIRLLKEKKGGSKKKGGRKKK